MLASVTASASAATCSKPPLDFAPVLMAFAHSSSGFVVSMSFTGEQNDDVFTPLHTSIELLEA